MFYVAKLYYNDILYVCNDKGTGRYMTNNRDCAEVFPSRAAANEWSLVGHVMPCNQAGKVPSMSAAQFYAATSHLIG